VARVASGVLLSALMLGGCTATPPESSHGDLPSARSQDEQDSRTFRDLYARYVALPLDTVKDDDLTSLLTGDLLQEARAEIADSQSAGKHLVGEYTYSAFLVTDHGHDETGIGYMVAQACLDVSGTRIHDAAGEDVTPGRDPLLSMQMKAIQTSEAGWRISDALRNDEVRACD
jgi:hypothetical protein